ncbi:transglycosylase domain-containing protein [Chryseobacterium camelliae]|uniref:Transglycosylase domain-containing protein n=1 Tax=Chryseobacterium camelliae TaxID=1265445 RepID=A0ABY7QKX8_9FLAO|nr:transglycosylase domain-containing protein [Chryseobacterium camelliae]WBV60333.1 transglycosylase domain-containing protein [Chryseobacterium camelliae]
MKYLKRNLLLLLTILVLFILYLEFGGRFILDTTDKRIITFSIRSSKKLPENFTNFYNIIYPNSLSENSWGLISHTILNSRTSRKECPCNQMAYSLFPRIDIKNKTAIDYFLVARYIEHKYNQRDCLNFNFSNFDFLEGRRGIEQVSKSLFNKNVENLSTLEMSEILALYENPVKNNRNRYHEHAETKAQYFNYLYLKNSTR